MIVQSLVTPTFYRESSHRAVGPRTHNVVLMSEDVTHLVLHLATALVVHVAITIEQISLQSCS